MGEAVARALSVCGARRVQVKWPNDVVVDFRKLAGILVETSGEMQGPSVAVIGVGVNYRSPSACSSASTSRSPTYRSASTPSAAQRAAGRDARFVAAALEQFERAASPRRATRGARCTPTRAGACA